MKVHIIGKNHRKGTSKKNGNPYDFWELHYTGPQRGVTGEAAIVKTVDPGLFDLEAMTVPGDYLVEYDGQGNIISLSTVTAPGSAAKQ
ncbi:hypothetical protein [Vermiculatibacterium agrestimuris]|uniref:hypothetical protein n=1 Tax=Vermiculatibacterium agrestimuris TaxID=2941519 RepID=UPI00203B86F0|nr:hypothetical protein [Vermiculatibacterium agrestimuris]